MGENQAEGFFAAVKQATEIDKSLFEGFEILGVRWFKGLERNGVSDFRGVLHAASHLIFVCKKIAFRLLKWMKMSGIFYFQYGISIFSGFVFSKGIFKGNSICCGTYNC